MVPLFRALQRVLGKVLGTAAELRDGCQLEDGHGLGEDADGLLPDLLLLGLACVEAGPPEFRSLAASSAAARVCVRRAAVLVASAGEKEDGVSFTF